MSGTIAMPEVARISPAQAAAFVDLARLRGGLSLDARKTQFFETRLGALIREARFGSAEALLAAARADSRIADTVLERLTTHTTSFFREPGHYKWLQGQGFARLTQRALTSSEPFTIWSAACSTGAELWSAGMEWLDWQGTSARKDPLSLIGTDVSQRILRICAGATYRDEEVQGVPPARRNRYLLCSRTARDGMGKPYWRIAPALRARAAFLQANLQKLEQLRPFNADVVFLRNVLIYFEPDDRDRVVRAVVRRIRTGGVLMTGHAERIEPDRYGLRSEGPSLFVKES
jgi:chemotaxis protein methyltransferase CheR